MTQKAGETWIGLFCTRDSTGALAVPGVGPAGALYVNGTLDAAGVAIAGANPYSWTVSLPAGLGIGNEISMYITATIAGVATGAVVAEDVIDEFFLSDIPDAVWDEALAGHLGAGSTGEALDDIVTCTCGGGANAFTYTVTDSGTGLPIDGVHVWITTDAAGLNVIWNGYTDAFGVARTSSGSLPMLDAGNFYFWKEIAGFIDDQNPDLEAVP